MIKIKEHNILLFDLDNTILDFTKAENYAIRRLAQDFNITLTDDDVERYRKINSMCWHLSDSGVMSKAEILKKRFIDFFDLFEIKVDGHWCDVTYREYLTHEVFLVDDAIEVLDELVKEHDLYIVSNGVKSTQHVRMQKANITKYFKDVFLSDEIGYPKPEKEFFDYVKSHINEMTKENTVLIGDNLFTDINGANNANIKSVYFNYFNKENNTDYKPVYEIKKLKEILEK